MSQKNLLGTAFLLALILLPAFVSGQGTPADYERANALREKYQGKATDVIDRITWIDKTNRFWYRKTVAGGAVFMLVDAAAPVKAPAFDHERLAVSLSAAAGETYTGTTLPFTTIAFSEDGKFLEFDAAGSAWTCGLSDYVCTKTGPSRGGPGMRGARSPYEDDSGDPGEFENDVIDGMTTLSPQVQPPFGPLATAPPSSKPSPDGEREALIRNFNVHIRLKGETETIALSHDGSEGDPYTLASVAWSPDSRRIAVYRVRPGYPRLVHYVESSPGDQLQPKSSNRRYVKPGDPVDIAQPVLFDIAAKTQTIVDNALFPNPYSLSEPVWRKDSRAFTFEYNERGHQVYRAIEVEAATGRARALIEEKAGTFFSYRPLTANLRETGTRYRHDLADGKEILWASERDGWRHLYLYDGATGKMKTQVTKGPWVVRFVDKVDEEKRQVWFQASGMIPGQDPYFNHFYRINLDGTGLTALTEADGLHAVTYSEDMRYYVDTWSRVDLAPVAELRRTEDRKLLLELERGDLTALTAAGWRPPERFTAKGRDGTTDIHGVIFRPTGFDPAQKYPVLESIYAGPQGSFVPKTFSPTFAQQAMAEVGFIVVQIDGMGTANRSKAFHDIAWKNLGDAGFPDRILWHQAVAAKNAAYDIGRVGLYGGSAGGQNSTGGLLFHPEFYKAAASNCGCHDNRMDKMWWNEQWMGWPLGPHYTASSNVDNAHRLKGRLFLIVGEMDTNVDPASTYQVVNALIKAGKTFDLLVVPSGGHGAGGDFGLRMQRDFFVRHLLGIEPPAWNAMEK